MLKRFAALILSALLPLSTALPAHADAYNGQPKLVVVIVIDQFRADYLERYRADFKDNGFRLFLDHGAWFPDCYYDYANTKTAPGHSTLATGAYTSGHGIGSNEWWDLTRNRKRPISSVEDDRYTLVSAPAAPPPTTAAPPTAAPTTAVPAEATSGVSSGTASPSTTPQASSAPGAPASAAQGNTAPAAAVAGPAVATEVSALPGASPRNLLASTLGDELRLATQGQSRLYGVSLKDRAAILTAGHAANGAFWIDGASGRFVTSSYYMKALPQWAVDFDNGPAIAQAESAAQVANPTDFYEQVGATNAGNMYEVQFAEALIAGEHLGGHATTDMLTLSLSPNDIEGHMYGPDSAQEHAMVDGLDGDLDSFFSWLDKNVPGGLANVVLALSADHGIAPTPAVSAGMGLPGAYINVSKLVADLNQAMNAKFSPGENNEYLLTHQELPYLSLNQPMFERAGINEQEAEDAVKAAVPHAFASLAPPADAMIEPKTPAAPQTPAAPPPAAGPSVAGSETGQKASAQTSPTRDRTQEQARAETPGTNPGAKPDASAKANSEPNPDATLNQPPPPPPARHQLAPRLYRDYTRVELAAGNVAPDAFGRLIANSYTPNGGWYVAVWPIAFQMQGSGSGTNHFSPFNYDRHVPLAFYGAPFAPGTYRGNVQPVDLAVTLASVLGINEPSAAVGQVLTQALKPAAEYPYPQAEAVEHHRRPEHHRHVAVHGSPATEKPQP